MANVNLIPTEERKRQEGVGSTMVIMIIVIVVVAIIVGGLFLYQRILSVNIDETQVEIEGVKKEKAKYADVEEEGKILEKQLSNLRQVLNNHVYWSELFWILEEKTLTEVDIQDLDASDPGTVVITGAAPTYGQVAKQVVAYMSDPFFSDYQLPGASLVSGDNGSLWVQFSLTLSVADGALEKSDSEVVEDSLRPIDLKTSQPTEEVKEEGSEEESGEGENTE